MASTARPNLGRRLRPAVAGAAVLTALTTATAAAVVPPMQTSASQTTRPDPGSGGTGPPSEFPGFLLDRGRYTPLEAPRPGVELTEAVKVNDRGQVVGTFSTDTPIVNDAASFHGYLWDRGKVTRIDAPGAVGTTALGVNNRAQVVGAYTDDAGTAHGYVWDRGRFTTIDVPGAVITQPLDINDHGQVLGFSFDDLTLRPGTIHGYLWDRGRLVTIDAPDVPVTLPSDINNRGQIVGNYQNPNATPSPQHTGAVWSSSPETLRSASTPGTLRNQGNRRRAIPRAPVAVGVGEAQPTSPTTSSQPSSP
jgi:uncharacterized membrane protein